MTQVLTGKKEASAEFYVTEECNGCGLCNEIAPGFFQCVEYSYAYYLTRQPVNEAEVLLLRNSAEACAVDAIRETVKTS